MWLMLGPEVSSMYSRILFAVDDDEALAAAVPVVAAYARRWGAAVRVLHVHRMDSSGPGAPCRQLVRSVVERLQGQGVRAEGDVRLLHRGESVGSFVARTATNAEADLVAIGSRGRSDLGGLFLGSVSHAVSSGLAAPVLVVRAGSAGAAEPRTVLVAVDGSTASDEAAAEAAEVAASFGAGVHVLHVRPLVAAQGTAFVEPEVDARAIVGRALAEVERRGVPATAEVQVGNSVAGTIVSVAIRIGAGLVVLGSRRPSHLDGLLTGSVAHEVVHQLRCPVLLARRARVQEAVR
jgi:nucleotide-binding universal stress UspA family protein